jgi:hypothetical protein
MRDQSAKMGNIRIQMVGFLNQNSLFRAWRRKVFFASEHKIVLQQIQGQNGHDADIAKGPTLTDAVEK